MSHFSLSLYSKQDYEEVLLALSKSLNCKNISLNLNCRELSRYGVLSYEEVLKYAGKTLFFRCNSLSSMGYPHDRNGISGYFSPGEVFGNIE